MPTKEILVSVLGHDRRAAVLVDSVLTRFAVDPPPARPIRGDVLVGRVIRVVPALDGAFLDLGGGETGLLMAADAAEPGRKPPPIGTLVAEGMAIGVEVLREADAPKAAKLAARPRLSSAETAGRGSEPRFLHQVCRPVLQTILDEADDACASIICDDVAVLGQIRGALKGTAIRIEHHRGPVTLFARFPVEEQLASALAPRIGLPGGGEIAIAETEALVAIDVDTGSAAAGGVEGTALAVNLDAAEAIVRLVRLRDLGGHLVIDPVPMRRQDNRQRLLDALRSRFAGDPCEVAVGGYTPLGLVHLTRMRTGPSLARRMSAACPACEGAGRVRKADLTAADGLRALLAEARALPGARLRLALAGADLASLRGGAAAALTEAEGRLGRPVSVVLDGTLPPGTFRVEPMPVSGSQE
jgi:Ribonuclease G/E